MKRTFAITLIASLLLPSLAGAASNLPSNVTSATVLIANYNEENNFIGWGSGFFVDEGTVVTNKHVIKGGDWYRVYATKDEAVNMECYKNITKSDVKINLEDDVAYMRVFLSCDHGIMNFAYDPVEGYPVSVQGYPYKGNAEDSLKLTVTTGKVIGESEDGWLLTDAYMDFGNSGGPVVDGENVLGVAVAKSVDSEGNFAAGYFIPSSVILKGLLYANDSRFGYTPRGLATSPVVSSSSSSVSSSSLSSSSSSSSLQSSSRSSMSNLQIRTCTRVIREYGKFPSVLKRLNERLQKRYGFICTIPRI